MTNWGMTNSGLISLQDVHTEKVASDGESTSNLTCESHWITRDVYVNLVERDGVRSMSFSWVLDDKEEQSKCWFWVGPLRNGETPQVVFPQRDPKLDFIDRELHRRLAPPVYLFRRNGPPLGFCGKLVLAWSYLSVCTIGKVGRMIRSDFECLSGHLEVCLYQKDTECSQYAWVQNRHQEFINFSPEY